LQPYYIAYFDISAYWLHAGGLKNDNSIKYADLPGFCIFQPLAFETHGATHSSALDFLNAVGGRLADPRETTYLWQRVSVFVAAV